MYSPSVSIVVPAYNAETTIELCIKSLLNQNYPKDKIEIIVVDNKSTDNTAQLIKSYPVKYFSQDKKQQRAATRNMGIKNAKNEIIALIDSDCIADLNWLKNGVQCFKDESVGGVGGLIDAYKPESWIEKHLVRVKAFSQGISEERIKNKCAKIATANAFYRNSVFKKLKIYFNEDFEKVANEDLDLSYRILDKTSYIFAYDDTSVVYHKHAASLTELWEQYYRYGYGSLMTYKVFYPDILEEIKHFGYLKPFYWTIRCICLKNFPNTAKKFFGYIFCLKYDKKIDFIDSFLSLYKNSAYSFGQFKASLTYNIPFSDIIIPEDKKVPL